MPVCAATYPRSRCSPPHLVRSIHGLPQVPLRSCSANPREIAKQRSAFLPPSLQATNWLRNEETKRGKHRSSKATVRRRRDHPENELAAARLRNGGALLSA